MKPLNFGLAAVLGLSMLAMSGCHSDSDSAGSGGGGGGSAGDHIQVQHILISFKGSPVRKPTITRTKEEAEKVAKDLFEQAKKDGANFDELVKKYTDDAAPGIYGMANNGAQPGAGEYPRGGMVPAFGNVGFNLKVGEVGFAPYDPQNSPFGYHIIKRLK